MHADSDGLNDLSGRVAGYAFTVLNTLGVGCLEKVYENALAHEMPASGFAIVQQSGIKVYNHDVVVGEYFADPLVEDAHRMQCTNYLKATGLRLCLLLNFGRPRLEIRRVVNGL